MRFERPLVQGVLLARRKRFFADVALEGGVEVVAHCANPGRMTSAAEPGWRVWCSPADPVALSTGKRKLAWNLELVEAQPSGALLLVNTARPNGIVAEAIAAAQIPELLGYLSQRAEVRYGENSRVDLLLEGEEGRCYVEVKNATLLLAPGLAGFPDAVSARATKHLGDLAQVVAEGHRGVMFSLCRSDAARLAPAEQIDPAYASAYRAALKAGVESIAYQVIASAEGLRLGPRVETA